MSNPNRNTINSFNSAIDSHEFVRVSLEKGNYCLYNISEEYNRILQDPESWDWGIPLIESLVEFVRTLKDPDDTISVFHRPEWSEIVHRRGPIEAVFEAICPACSCRNFSFDMSGFLDIDANINHETKTVTFFSSYDDSISLQRIDSKSCWNCGAELNGPTREFGIYLFWRNFRKVRKDLKE